MVDGHGETNQERVLGAVVTTYYNDTKPVDLRELPAEELFQFSNATSDGTSLWSLAVVGSEQPSDSVRVRVTRALHALSEAERPHALRDAPAGMSTSDSEGIDWSVSSLYQVTGAHEDTFAFTYEQANVVDPLADALRFTRYETDTQRQVEVICMLGKVSMASYSGSYRASASAEQ